MCEWVMRSKRRQRKRGSNRLLQLTGIPQGAHQPVMRFVVRGIGCDGLAKCIGCPTGVASSQKIDPPVRQFIAGLWIIRRHDCY